MAPQIARERYSRGMDTMSAQRSGSPDAAPRLQSQLGQVVPALRRRDPRALTLLGLLLVLVAGLATFGHLVEDYLTGDPLVEWDTRFALWLHERASDPLVGFFKIVTLAGNSVVAALVVATVAIFLVRRGWLSDAAALALALTGAGVLNALLKLVFHRPRPELAFVHLETYSFPSGHAAVSAAVYATLAFLLIRRSRRGAAKVGIALAAFVVIALVAFSRLYLGAHYLSDVLAGLSFGIVWATICLIAYMLIPERALLSIFPQWAQRLLVRIGLPLSTD